MTTNEQLNLIEFDRRVIDFNDTIIEQINKRVSGNIKVRVECGTRLKVRRNLQPAFQHWFPPLGFVYAPYIPLMVAGGYKIAENTKRLRGKRKKKNK